MDELLKSKITELEAMSSEEVRRIFFDAARVTVQKLAWMAAAVRVLEDRGDDLADLQTGLLQYVRKIAYGQTSAEVVSHFQGMPMLLERVISLPLPDQDKVLAGPVKVMLPDGDSRLVAATRLNRNEIVQVFAKDHIRDDGEQVGFLKSRPPATARPEVVVDSKAGGIYVGGKFLSRDDLKMYLERLKR